MFKQVVFWLFLISLIVFRYFTTRPVYKDGDSLRITSRIFSDPIIYAKNQYLKIAGITIYLPKETVIGYGDKIVVEGILKNGKLDNVKIVSVKEGNSLSFFRDKVVDFYQKNLPQPESGLLAGIVLGAKGPVDPDFYNLTKMTGLTHVVVASGTNVTFVVSFLSAFLFLYLPRKKAIPLILIGIVLYLFISGFDAPLVRAAVMSGIAFLIQATGRVFSAWRIYFLTAGLMLFYSPDWAFDLGFLLSFASVGSMMLFQKRIADFIKFVPGFIREDLATTLSAQVGVTPILFVIFGQFNILSPLINLMVLWTIPPLMIIGSVGGIVGLLLPQLRRWILFLAYPLLWWFCHIVAIFS